jgi:hypothetical protein
MDTTIYRKSALGNQEIAQRSLGLPPRLRSLLIMIDGRRTAQQLAALSPVPLADALAELLGHGLVEAAGEAPPEPKPAAPRAAARPAQAMPRAPSLDSLRREVPRALSDLVGPMAESLSIKIEKATSAETIVPLLQVAVQVVRNTRGAQAAQEFAQRFNVPVQG